MKGLIGKKIFLNQLFTVDGKVVPVTVIEVLPNVVSQVKIMTKDKYNALQLAAGYKKEKHLHKSIVKHLAKSKTKNKRILCEFRDMDGYSLGSKIDVSLFQDGDFVDIQAISKGKGTAGVIKRHNFSRGPMSHGSKHHRAPGSIGLSRPDKVWKGQPLPGRKGNQKVTIQNLLVVKVDLDANLLIIKGSTPGSHNSFCRISLALKHKKRKPLNLLTFLSSANSTEKKQETLKSSTKGLVETKSLLVESSN